MHCDFFYLKPFASNLIRMLPMQPTKPTKQINLFIILSTVTLLLISSMCFGATYYVDATNGNDSNSGTSQSTPWKAISKVNNSNFQPGDFILFKRGEIWRERLKVPSSGSLVNPITFGAYGLGNKPIITARDDIRNWTISGNWTKAAINVWCIDKAFDPHRVWLDGTEYQESETKAKINATNRWWYDSASHALYVYATTNPVSTYSSIEAAWADVAKGNATIIENKSYLTFQNLDLRGGTWTMFLYPASSNVTNITIDSCTIAIDAGQVGIYGKSESGSYEVNYVEIKNCTISSEIPFSYDWFQTYSDGIVLGTGCNYWKIHDNTIKDWMHALIAISCLDADRTSSNNEVYDNYMTLSDNITYCRAFSIEGTIDGTCQYNKFYNNYIKKLKCRSQIGGDHNEVYYNVFDTMVYDVDVGGWTGMAQAISVADYGINISQYNKIYNNIIYNTDEPGIVVMENTSGGREVKNNEIINNIIISCGNDSDVGHDDICLWIEGEVGGNTFKNNLMYKSGITNVLNYRGTDMTMAEFNNENGSNYDTIEDNLQSDPKFVDISIHNFQLKRDSPCKDAGLDVGLSRDYSGASVPQGTGVEIGAFEYKNNSSPTLPHPPTALQNITD